MSDLTTLLKGKLAFDEQAYTQEATRYAFTKGHETRDGEHLSTEQVFKALRHLAKFDNARLSPLHAKLLAVVEAAENITQPKALDVDECARFADALVVALAGLREACGE